MKNTASLDSASHHASRVFKFCTTLQYTPFILIPFAFAFFEFYEPKWKYDIFLILILVLFVIGQIFSFFQFKKLRAGAQKTLSVIHILKSEWQKGSSFDELENILEKSAPSCHVRDIIFRWIEQARQNDDSGFNFLLDNSANRRMVSEERMVSVHISINRTLLKLGFLGTLIGLLMTFPPMKEAILALKAMDGEMKFITDIASAVDGDQYAVLTTLFATGFSALLEVLTIQVLTRLHMRFEICNNYLEEWNVVQFRPRARAEFGDKSLFDKVVAMQLALEKEMLSVQNQMSSSIKEMANTLNALQNQFLTLSQTQHLIGNTVEELALYEKKYQDFVRNTRFNPNSNN